MSRDEAIEKLKELQHCEPESAHLSADRVLCKLLEDLGYADVVAEWEKVSKWYA